MQIRISNDWWEHYVMEQYGKTRAEKEGQAEQIFSSPGRSWAKTMNKNRGQWLDVETDYLFDDQFNTETARVMAKHIDGIKFGPEFNGLDDFKAAVQKRYDKDWPGSVVRCAILSHYIKQGFIEEVTR